jgi:RNA polymerase sigma-70 factor (ECF subfamily)
MRHVSVVHLLWKNVSQGTERFLLRPHGTWTVDGRTMLAPLTKKVVAGDAHTPGAALQRTLDTLRHEDLRQPPPLARLRLRPATRLRLRSPAQGVDTWYHVLPATARCPADQRDGLAAELGGVWMTRFEALREPTLSPTARVALEGVRATPSGPMSAQYLAGDWTQRLLHARDHDSRVFGRLFQDMTPYLRKLARGLLERPEDCEDVLSEACLQALAHLDTYEPITSPATWMGKILHNIAVSMLRKRTGLRRRNPSSLDTVHEVADFRHPVEAIEEAEELARGRALLQEELKALTPLQRLAWRLRHQEDMEYREISETLNVKIGTLGTWFHKVRTNLEQREAQRGS